jgi:hypothetical protein
MRDRTPDGVGSEAGETAMPAFSADDGPGYPHSLWQFRESVLFIGTQFSILYTSMYSPAEAATPRA